MDSELSDKQLQAAALVADDRLTNERIADRVGVTRKTIERWKSSEPFATHVKAIVQAARAEAMQHGIAVKEERVRGYQQRSRLMWQLLAARAEHGRALRDAAVTGKTPGGLPLPDGWEKAKTPPPGIETGLLVKQTKFSPSGVEITEWAVDTGTLTAMLALEKQAAVEMGQWTEKSDITGTVTLADVLSLAAQPRPSHDDPEPLPE